MMNWFAIQAHPHPCIGPCSRAAKELGFSSLGPPLTPDANPKKLPSVARTCSLTYEIPQLFSSCLLRNISFHYLILTPSSTWERGAAIDSTDPEPKYQNHFD